MESGNKRPSGASLFAQAAAAFLILALGVVLYFKPHASTSNIDAPVPEKPPVGHNVQQPSDTYGAADDTAPVVEILPAADEEQIIRAVGVTVAQLLDGSAAGLAQEAGANAIVIDMKHDNGKLEWLSQEAAARNVGANSTASNINARIAAALDEADLYAIARVSAFRDHLIGFDVGCTVETLDGKMWADDDGIHWSSLSNHVIRTYIANCAVELTALGFDEIVMENVTSPTRGNLALLTGGERFDAQLQKDFLTELYAAVGRTGAKLSLLMDAETFARAEPLTALTAVMVNAHFDRVWLREGDVAALTGAGIETENAVTVTDTLSADGASQAVLP